MKKNLLSLEKSPYLIQHKDNPVHWMPWSEEAFSLAKKENKPVLLSVGYAACHWCHVMAHESFEDDDVASLMNEHFINIKVDREERPDIDAIYMSSLQAMGVHGGWPMTIFMTPEKKAFWGGTYFSKESLNGMPSFPNILIGLSNAYKNDKDVISENYKAIDDAIRKKNTMDSSGSLSTDILDRVSEQLLNFSDQENGGLRGAPKFPNTATIDNLWRAFIRTGKKSFRDQVVLTLTRMSNGGIYDQLGGGFSRYSVDDQWLVPHFEKMLYDNALLIDIFSTVYKVEKNPLFKIRVEEIIDWVISDMVTSDGGICSAIDADSEGVEGKYYVWKAKEIDALLQDESSHFKSIFGVTAEGNFEGNNILVFNGSVSDIFDKNIIKSRSILFNERMKRIPPLLDDKILTDWNSLMISSLARASAIFENQEWIKYAENAYEFILNNLIINGTLYHSWREGEVRGVAMLDDHVALIDASISLYIVTKNKKYLDVADTQLSHLNEYFIDEELGGYYLTSINALDVPIRMKVSSDSATPSGNGLLFKALVTWWRLSGRIDLRENIAMLEKSFGKTVAENFSSHCTWISGFESFHKGTNFVVVGDQKK
ncbi:thioredoxin domain-containing protein [Hyphomicrobiales bacterium]|nr:thioredoxin domain-containing protein [Hyphomicrobiales bacterium]